MADVPSTGRPQAPYYNKPTSAWREALLPASFDGRLFHVESSSLENGRRIAVHEFPKKDTPYPEDMGRRAKTFSVRGYCITYPADTNEPLYSRDYRVPRDLLMARLEAGGPGPLQLPTLPPILVVCPQWRWTEEDRLGGYCVFDMQFVEWGTPNQSRPASTQLLMLQSQAIKQQVLTALSNASESLRVDQLRQ